MDFTRDKPSPVPSYLRSIPESTCTKGCMIESRYSGAIPIPESATRRMQVQSGAFEVGALSFAVWENELKSGKINSSKVRVIWRTPTYPDYQWSIRGDVNEVFGTGFTNKVRAALLSMDEPELLESFPRSGFIPASNDDYEPIVRVGKDIGLLD